MDERNGMSREQWGHGYWKGVQDAQNGKIKSKFSDEVKYWIAMMCSVNEFKSYDKSLYSVSDFIFDFNLSEKYAKRVYDYVLNNNYYEFRPNQFSWCYISGEPWDNWHDDYFVLPGANYSPKEWCIIVDEFREKWGWFKKEENGVNKNC